MIKYGEVWKDDNVVRMIWAGLDGEGYSRVFDTEDVYKVLTEISKYGWMCYNSILTDGKMIFYIRKKTLGISGIGNEGLL